MRLYRVELYVLRIAASAFGAVLITLTSVIWVTQALREFDLLTSKGQTAMVFFVVTGLSLPLLFLVIAPVALLMGVVFTYNRLGGDSELIVMTSAGLPPQRVLRPLFGLACCVAVVVGYVSIDFAPTAMRILRQQITKIRADVVANIVQPGRFTAVDKNLTFHIRARQTNGLFNGILVYDRRDPNQEMTYTAETGRIVESGSGSFFVLEDGSLQRRLNRGKPDVSIVYFERYAFDLSQFGADAEAIHYKPRERTFTELLSPDPRDHYFLTQPGRYRSEIHERLVAPLYPLAFVMCAFAFLGQARSTREEIGVAMTGTFLLVGIVRIGGFAATALVGRSAAYVPLVYAIPFTAMVFGYLAGTGRINIPAPTRLIALLSDIIARVMRPVRAAS